MTEPQTPAWVTIGQRNPERIRVDQIAHWTDQYYNGWQHYLTVTLIGGKEVRAEINSDQWDAFQKAVRQ